MKILIVNDSKENIGEAFLNKWVDQVCSELLKKNILNSDLNQKELSLVFLEERDAKRINWQYRTKDYATDVLSFKSDDPQSFGELVLCPFVIKRQAEDHKLKFDQELAYMILHGILHLLGYDHEKGPEDEKKMMSIQDEIFEKYMLKKSGKASSAGAGKSASAKSGASSAKLASAKAGKASAGAKSAAAKDSKSGGKKLSVTAKKSVSAKPAAKKSSAPSKLVANKKKSSKESASKRK